MATGTAWRRTKAGCDGRVLQKATAAAATGAVARNERRRRREDDALVGFLEKREQVRAGSRGNGRRDGKEKQRAGRSHDRSGRRGGAALVSGEVAAESGGDGREEASFKSMAGTVGVGQRRKRRGQRPRSCCCYSRDGEGDGKRARGPCSFGRWMAEEDLLPWIVRVRQSAPAR